MQSTAVERAAVKVAQASPERAVRVRMSLLDGGMRTDKSPSDLAPNEAVHIHNMTVLQGLLQVSKGYAAFSGVYLGVAQKTFQAFYADGTNDTILVTTQTMYRWVGAVNQWQLLTYLLAYSTTGTVAAGVQVFPLAAVTGLANGQMLGVILDDGTQLIGKITNITALNVTTDTPVPVGRTVALGAAVMRAVPLNGDATTGQHQVQALTFVPNRWIIVSNAVDPVLYVAAGVVLVLPGLPANTTCKTMCVAHEQLLLGNLIENGTLLPYRVRASDQADPTTWTPGTGIAAVYDLLDTDDAILSMRILGPYVITYRERTVMRATYLGVANFTWLWEYTIYGEGIFSQGGVVSIGAAQHFLVGTQGIYLYAGAYELESIGDAVFPGFISAVGTLNAPHRSALFVMYVGQLDEVWVFYPDSDDTVPANVLRCRLENTAWFQGDFVNHFLSASSFTQTVAETWATAVGIWSTDTVTWNSGTTISNIDNVLMCASDAASVMAFDYTKTTDAGVAVPWHIITRAFADDDGRTLTRWDDLVVTALGADVLVEASVDDGATWQPVDTLSFDTTLQPRRTYLQTVAARIQFRFSGTDSAFQLRNVDVVGEYESDW